MVKLTYIVSYMDKPTDSIKTMDIVVSAATYLEAVGKAKKAVEDVGKGLTLTGCAVKKVEYVQET